MACKTRSDKIATMLCGHITQRVDMGVLRTCGHSSELGVSQRPHNELAVAEVEHGAPWDMRCGACCDGGSRAVTPVAQHAVEEAAASEVVHRACPHAWRVYLDVEPPCDVGKA